jgi:hypothetical protein
MEPKTISKNGAYLKSLMSRKFFLRKVSMKKVIISFAIMMAAVLTGSAQIFVGGSIGLSHSAAERKDGSNTIKQPTQFGFNISPKIGYELSSELALGVNFRFASHTSKQDKDALGPGNPAEDRKTFSKSFGIGGFGRYALFEISKFALIAEGHIGIAGSSSKTTTGSVTVEAPSSSTFYISVFPALAYNLTDKLTLDVSLSNLLNLGFTSTTTTIKPEPGTNGNEIKAKSSHFGLNASSFPGNINDWFNAINVGFYYKF